MIGVVVSSHQNEGNNFRNNWWDWEIEKGYEKSGIACNSWIEYKRDIDAIVKLGCDSYRMSLEWSRIFLDETKIDNNALQHYKKMIMYCREVGIEPIITLHYFTRPRWFDKKYGGLHNNEIIGLFQKYVEVVIKEMVGLVKYWITFNEPMIECVNGYLKGTRPPGLTQDFESMYSAIINILECHCVAYDTIKKYDPNTQIGLAKNLVDYELQYYYDKIKKNIENQIIHNYSWCILDALYKGELNFGISLIGFGINKSMKNENWKNKMDFLGISHHNVGYVEILYSSFDNIDVKLAKDDKYMKNGLGWDVKPDSIINVVKLVIERYGNLDIMITESGSCGVDKNDNESLDYVIDTHMKSILEWNESNSTGKIIGYMWGTLIDCIKWEYGKLPKFGLYYLRKGELRLKSSGKKFMGMISSKKISNSSSNNV